MENGHAVLFNYRVTVGEFICAFGNALRIVVKYDLLSVRDPLSEDSAAFRSSVVRIDRLCECAVIIPTVKGLTHALRIGRHINVSARERNAGSDSLVVIFNVGSEIELNCAVAEIPRSICINYAAGVGVTLLNVVGGGDAVLCNVVFPACEVIAVSGGGGQSADRRLSIKQHWSTFASAL